jgi:sirohydrochlorin ferrochelatase
MKGILILAHGSREKETEKTMDKIAEMVFAKLPETLIETAYLQFCSKNLETGLNSLIQKGVDNIHVVPYFLFYGIHIREDIPAAINEYLKKRPDVKVTMGETLGVDERLADILADRIRQAL